MAFRQTFIVHTYEVDAFDTVAVPALAGFLQEAAGIDARERGFGIEDLGARGLTWMLVRQALEVLEPIRLGDALEVETWPSGVERLVALRDFLVRRSGVVVARATTQWLSIDLASRRPVRPDRVLAEAVREEHVLAVGRGRLPDPAAGWEAEKRFPVRYQDIDRNLHVNNTSYLAWAVEALPQEIWASWRLASLEVQYLAEGLHGGTVVSRIAGAGEGAFHHCVLSEEGGKELARMRTRWERRGAAARRGAPGG